MPIEISRRAFPVKRISFVTLILIAIALLSSSCGTSDYMQSIQLTSTGGTAGGFYNLAGVDGTLQLQVLAVYHSGKMIDVTNNSTFTMTPVGSIFTTADATYPAGSAVPAAGPNTVTINPNGLMTGLAQICTWEDGFTTTTTNGVTTITYDNPAVWEYTGYYQTVATYRGFTSQPVGVGLGIAESNAPGGGCGPS
jgi:hypothetical protein